MTVDVGAISPELPPFGTAERCAKCTCPDIDDRYHRGIPGFIYSGDDLTLAVSHTDTRECLLRTCQDCGWSWLEACADADHVVQGDQKP